MGALFGFGLTPNPLQLYMYACILVNVCVPKFGLRAIDRVEAAVLTQSRHWRRSTLRYKIYVTLLLRRVSPPPVDIWLRPGSCAQYKFMRKYVYIYSGLTLTLCVGLVNIHLGRRQQFNDICVYMCTCMHIGVRCVYI